MGFMNEINYAMTDALPAGGNPLIQAAIQLLKRSGGVNGLAQLFQSRGLGNVVQSWVSTGPNLPIDENHIENVFGRDQLETVARETNMPMHDLTSGLSTFLPDLVNEMTPEGQVPQSPPDMKQLLSIGMRLLNH
jgi:uncharacterized protein YidB (DUF937 family)